MLIVRGMVESLKTIGWVSVLLLFMAELHEGLPLPVACSEAVELSVAYGGAKDFHRHVNGVLKAYHAHWTTASPNRRMHDGANITWL